MKFGIGYVVGVQVYAIGVMGLVRYFRPHSEVLAVDLAFVIIGLAITFSYPLWART